MKRGKSPKTIAANPHIVRALEARFQEGKKYELAKEFRTAEKIYREIVSTYQRHGYNPATPNAALGYVLMSLRKFKDAESVLERSVQQNPALYEGRVNLAAAYRFTERYQDCIKESKRALEIDPQNPEPLLSLAEAQKECRQYALAVQNFLLALSLDNNSILARRGLASCYVYLGDTSVAIPMFRKVFEMAPDSWLEKSYMMFAMQYDPTMSNQEVLQEHLDFAARIRKEVGPSQTVFPNSKNAGRKLKIGYISSDFKQHVVMRFIEQVLANHDRDKFELVLIATNFKKDKETERIRQYADAWLDICELVDDEAAALIYDQHLDILVDLAGHSGVPRVMLLARRLAPVQISWCGYSGTTGIDTIDYIIVDNVIAPPGEKTHFSEQPLRLPSAYLSFETPETHQVGPLPFERNGHITFGCMNNPSKINKYVVAWWAEILRTVPNSKLLMRYGFFSDPLVRERIAKMFRECGIPSERYDMFPGKKDFVTVYNDIDIALDTFPYNGTTTTCESLWMGVPVVTMRGDRFVARVGASLLTHIGLKDLVAESPEGYVALAAGLANAPEHLANLRHNLRSHLVNTPVFNPPAFTRGLEDAYIYVFQQWCDQTDEALPAA